VGAKSPAHELNTTSPLICPDSDNSPSLDLTIPITPSSVTRPSLLAIWKDTSAPNPDFISSNPYLVLTRVDVRPLYVFCDLAASPTASVDSEIRLPSEHG